MSDSAAIDRVIDQLARELRPVRRLPAPGVLACWWLLAAVLLAVPLGFLADFPAMLRRFSAQADMWVSVLGAALTAVTGAYAAFLTAVPGRARMAPLLPLPPAIMWISASTLGCLRAGPLPGAVAEPPMHAVACMNFLLLVSVPLGVLLTWLLSRAYPLRPGVTAALAGLACAGASACLLTLIHPFDATAEDLLVHLGAVLLVVGVARWLAPRWLGKGV